MANDGPPDRPNFLVIMSDQHNPHVLGASGNDVVRTPNLDRLASEGVRFRNAYCTFPLCVPSRMAFLTGRHSCEIEVFSNECFLRSDVPTFAHGLGFGGYETVLCGRMHIVGPDQHHGFTTRLAGDLCTSYGYHKDDLLGACGSIPRPAAGDVRTALEFSGPGRTTYQAYDDHVTDVCLDYLEKRAAGRAGSGPLCLVLGYVLPHCPYVCPRDLFDEYYEQIRVPELPEGYRETLHPAVLDDRDRRGMDAPTPEQMRRALAAYYGMVTYLDRNVGRVLDALAASPLGQDTVVVYTSDHGDMAAEHRMWAKSCFYEGSVGAPLLASGPGVRSGVVGANVSLLDVGATLLDLGKCDPLPGAAGRSLAGFLAEGGAVADWPDTAFAEHQVGGAFQRMMRRGPWKLNYFATYDRAQLFNLAEDPFEFCDRAADPACREIVREMTARVLDGWSPEALRQRYNANRLGTDLLRQWSRAQDIDGPYFWKAPDGCVVFPEGPDGPP